ARGDVIAAHGTMGFEVIDACDAWAVRQRLAITVTGRDGTDIDLASDYTTWESKDGLKMRFRMRQTTDDAVVNDLTGTAELERPGGPGRATYTQPADTTRDLPAGTLFPTAHTEAILAAAKAGKRFIALPLFDGTSADGAQDSTIAIVGWNPPAATAWPELTPLPSTRVRIAFFEREGNKQQPEYEVGMRYWENGVADQLNMDFGDYVLSGKLTELTLPKPGC
ncbi:MAG: DUF1849 family protein, partial [Acetobacteraceae bacterium]|nr:DUF1849 family protein [Acetobacteraceae bacterium]